MERRLGSDDETKPSDGLTVPSRITRITQNLIRNGLPLVWQSRSHETDTKPSSSNRIAEERQKLIDKLSSGDVINKDERKTIHTEIQAYNRRLIEIKKKLGK